MPVALGRPVAMGTQTEPAVVFVQREARGTLDGTDGEAQSPTLVADLGRAYETRRDHCSAEAPEGIGAMRRRETSACHGLDAAAVTCDDLVGRR
ncbi:hypothetical protein J5Y09_18200 [Roseomonas sp. PWR1]|uniref:Uncharacterized protein n=1 Tax=Roseomonas nitratireducens TaxID=2820810 RepID=A0ABS4AWY1_9PROT|nr:hypothetical protein [Neoroseomonas nitratireducens]MBP0465864.1 hypothetical protein [Neoroseomonas nitratireducens]